MSRDMNLLLDVLLSLSLLCQCRGHVGGVTSPQPEVVVTTAGSTLTLDCYVDESAHDKPLLLWMFDTVIVAVNTTVHGGKGDRFKVIHGDPREFSLVIGQVAAEDQGMYICQVPPEIMKVYEVTVNVPPRIKSYMPYEDPVYVVLNTPLFTMECQADGKPKPTMKWIKQTGHHTTTTLAINSTTLNLTSVTKDMNGAYACIADNGFGPPDRHVFEVEVAFRPEIAFLSDDLHIGIGQNVSIQCVVYSNPISQIYWYRSEDSNLLLDHIMVSDGAQNGGHTMTSRLTLWGVGRSDEGLYVCRGKNKYGAIEKVIKLKGSPEDLIITSSYTSKDCCLYRLQWQVVSLSRLETLEINLEQMPDEPDDYNSQNVEEVSYPVTQEEANGVKAPYVHVTISRRSANISLGQRNLYIIEDLLPDTEYQLAIRVSNAFGFSPWSSKFIFRTLEILQNDEVVIQTTTHAMPWKESREHNKKLNSSAWSSYRRPSCCVAATFLLAASSWARLAWFRSAGPSGS